MMSELCRIKDAAGLDSQAAEAAEQLVRQLEDHASHNALVRRYYDQEFEVGDQLFDLQLISSRISNDWVTGWAAKAVDALAARVRLEGFAATDGLDDPVLDAVTSRNGLVLGYMQTLPSKLVHGCAFAVVNRGADGHAHVRFHSAEDASAIEAPDYRIGAVGAGLCVARSERTSWSKKRPVPTQANMYLPGRVVVIRRQDRTHWAAEPMGVPEPEPMMVSLTHLGSRMQPFGKTRITRYVRRLCDEAARTLFRAQVLSTFYMFPMRALMGLTDEQYDALMTDKMKAYVDAFLMGTRDANGQVPNVQQFNAASPQPFIEQLNMLAKQFSFETAVPLASLGVITSNPTSAEAIEAERGDICDVAERDIASDRESLLRVVRLAMAVEENVPVSGLDEHQLSVRPKFAPANMASLSARADAASKYAAVRQGFGDTDACAEMMGFDRDAVRGISAEVRRARGLDLMGELIGGGDTETGAREVRQGA